MGTCLNNNENKEEVFPSLCVKQAACIYISVLFVYTRSSSTAYTYLTVSSEAERLSLVDECLPIFARGLFGLRFVEVDGPWVSIGGSSPTFLHLPYLLHLLLLHFLHHAVLLSHHHCGDTHCHTLDQGQDEATDQGILKGDREATTDGKDSTRHETTHNLV